MSVHYKFKSALDFDTITFDGLHISVSDLKKAIMQQKRLGKTAEFDLQITNAQTKEEYAEETALIPKNTSLTIARIPLTNQGKKQWNPQEDSNANAARQTDTEQVHVDLSRMNGTEEDKIAAMMMQSTMDYDPNNYQRLRQSQTGEVPPNYRCYKCHQSGHWIKNCPLGNTEGQEPPRKTTGIPKSFINDQKQAELEAKPLPAPVEKKPDIPEDLICSICKDLFNDAVMIPCCGSSFCDECVRTALLESEDNECPDCHERGSSPGSLIPNRFLRTSVNSFRNETGYNNRPRPKAAPVVVVAQKPRVEEESRSVDNSVSQSPCVPGEEEPGKLEKLEGSPTRRESRNGSRDREPRAEDDDGREAVSDREDDEEMEGEKDDSDEDDNITVTVPPAHQQSRTAFRDRQVNGWSMMRGGMRQDYDRMGRGGYNNNNNNNNQSHGDHGGRTTSQEDRDGQSQVERSDDGRGHPHLHRTNSREDQRDRERGHGGGHREDGQQMRENVPGRHHDSHPGGGGDQGRYNRPVYNDQTGGRPPGGGYDNRNYNNHNNVNSGQNIPPGGGNSMNPYHGGPPRMGYEGNTMMGGGGGGPPQQHFNRGGPVPYGGGNPRFPVANQNYGMRGPGGGGPGGPPGVMPVGNRLPGPPAPMNDQLSNIYQGVAAKVGTGIIDDPLEAFNRIMREKEMRKEGERRRSPTDQRRSRSIEMNRRRGVSPERRHVSPRRSPERRMRGGDRRRRSSSYSSSRSRSRSRPRNRSRSPPMRKRSRSPPVQMNMRRSRTRSPVFDQRNRGRDMRPTNNFHRDERNYREEQHHHPHQHHNQMQHQQQQRGHDFNRGRGGMHVGGGGRGWNNGPHNRYPNEQQHQQNQQYYNNSTHGGNNHNNNNFQGAPQENYMHQSQQQQHYQQNRYDRDSHHGHGQPQQQQQSQQQYYNQQPHHQFMDRRSPNDQPPVPGVDDDRPPMHQQQQLAQQRRDAPNRAMDMGMDRRDPSGGGRHVDGPVDRRQPQQHAQGWPTGSRSVSPNADTRSREFSGDRRRRSRTPPSSNRQQTAHGKSESTSKDRRDHRDRGDVEEGRGSASKVRSSTDKRRESVKVEPSKDRERKATSSSRPEKEKERDHRHEKEKEKEKKRDSSEPDSKKAKDKSKKKKKSAEKEKEKEKEKKKSKKEKKEKKTKKSLEGSKSDAERGSREKDDAPEKNEEEQQERPRSEVKESEPVDVPVPQDQQQSTPKERGDQRDPNDTMESSKASSPGAENPSDSVLDIYGNIDYERELEDLAETDKSQEEEQKPSAEVPELSKWERDDMDDQSAGEERRNRSPMGATEKPEEGELGDDNKVTNEVLKRAEHALFSRAINAIRPIEIRAISSERKKLYSDADSMELGENLVIQSKTSSKSPELKPNVQITVAMKRSSSTERSVAVVEHKREEKQRDGKHSSEASPSESGPQKKLSVKERLGMKVTDDKRRRSPSPVRRVKITSTTSTTTARSEEEGGANRNRGNNNNEREREKEKEGVQMDRHRRRQSPEGHGNRNRSPAANRSRMAEERGGGGGGGRNNQVGNNSAERRVVDNRGERERVHQREYRNSGRNEGPRRDGDQQKGMGGSFNQQSRDGNRQRGHGGQKSRSRSPRRAEGLKREEMMHQERGKSRDKNMGRDREERTGDRRENVNRDRRTVTGRDSDRRPPADRERKRSRTATPTRDVSKKSKREEIQPPKGQSGGERKKVSIDEANFEPDYEQMDTDMVREERASQRREQLPSTDGKSLASPPASTSVQKGEEMVAKKRSRSPEKGSSSSDSSSDSSSESEDDEESKRKRKKSKHSKKSKKNKRSTSSDSEERKKSKKSKSKKSKKKKKHKHK